MSDTFEEVPVHSSGKLDRSADLWITQTVFMVLAAICVLTRAYVKCFIVRSNFLEDYLIYGAMVAYVVYTAVVIDGCLNGAVGIHPSLPISTDEAALGLRTWFITMVLYPWITLTIRAAVCVLLFRITHHTKKGYPWLIRIILVASTLSSLAFFFVLLLQCSPPHYFWTQVYGDEGFCRDRGIVTRSTTAYSVLSVVFDWSLGLMPIAILWNVRMNRRTKAAIAGLLSLGVIAGIAIIVRTTYLTRLKLGLRFLYEATDVAIWSVIEPALGMIASCAATFRPLFKNAGFGWRLSRSQERKHSVRYRLREGSPSRDPFKPVPETQESEVVPGFELPKDDRRRFGSDLELISS